MFKYLLLVLMIYFIIMWAFMMADVGTNFSVPWISETAEVMSRIAILLLFLFVILGCGVLVYGVVTMDPRIVGVLE